MIFAQEYYEGKSHDEYIKQEVDKVEEKVKQSKELSNTEKFEELESFMIWISNIYDIVDSNFFISYLFKDTTIDYLEGMIKYLDYLSINEDIQYMYPETVECIPEIIMSLHEVIENKKLLEQAERVISNAKTN